MESWPTDDRVKAGHDPNKRRAKGKVHPRNYPYITQGAVNAATLVKNNHRLSWTSIASPPRNQSSGHLHLGTAVNVFPSTRAPPINPPRNTPFQRAEQSANFLRTFLPDIDVATELIREQVEEEATLADELQSFDPYSGHLLATGFFFQNTELQRGCLAFPMGDTKNELNLSPFTLKPSGSFSLSSKSSSVRRFSTPIRQIVASKSVGETKDNFFAVRTYGTTSLLKLEVEGVRSRSCELSVSELATISSADVGGYPITDIKMLSLPSEAMVVNDHGIVYTHDLNSKTLTEVFSHNHDSDNTSHWLSRLGLTSEHSQRIAISSKRASLFDIRSKTSTMLYKMLDPRDALTAVEDCIDSDTITLCSTNEILWIDRRYPKKPMLAYKHCREFDRSLETKTLNLGNSLTLLTSRKNGLVTVYDASLQDDNLFHVNTSPYSLIAPSRPGEKCEDYFFMSSGVGPVRLFKLSESGSIDCTSMHVSQSKLDAVKVKQSQGLEALVKKSQTLCQDYGPLGSREFSRIDFSSAYDRIFRRDDETREEDTLTELIDQISSYWEESDRFSPQMFTTSDIARSIYTEGMTTSRGYFPQEDIDSSGMFSALAKGHLSLATLRSHAPGHYDTEPILRHFCLEQMGTDNVQTFADSFRRFDLAQEFERPIPSITLEARAREQLAVDLALSRDVFYRQISSDVSSNDQALETMTEALSLDGEPPVFEFGFFQPWAMKAGDETELEKQRAKASIPLPVRLMLQEWVVGSDPDTYIYRDAGESIEKPQDDRQTKFKNYSPQADRTQTATSSQFQRPPAIVASSALPPEGLPKSVFKMIPSHRVVGGSQAAPELEAESQEQMMASTQVLPGPFGGRPSGLKKKAAKKRLGGF